MLAVCGINWEGRVQTQRVEPSSVEYQAETPGVVCPGWGCMGESFRKLFGREGVGRTRG